MVSNNRDKIIENIKKCPQDYNHWSTAIKCLNKKEKESILLTLVDLDRSITTKVTGMRETANSLKGIVAYPKRIRVA